MTTPHEQNWKAVQTQQGTWVREPSDKGPAFEPSVCMVYSVSLERLPNEPGAAYFRRTEDATADVAALLAASPDMARALLALRGRAADAGAGIGQGKSAEQVAEMDMDIRVPAALVRDALAALRKAKVLP